MPPRKKKAVPVPAPLPEPPVLLPPPHQESPEHSGHIGLFVFGFLFLFTSLLLSSQAGKAQEFRAGVSATVLPTSYIPPERFPFEHWWNKLDATSKLMVGSSTALTVSIIPLGLLVWRSMKRKPQVA